MTTTTFFIIFIPILSILLLSINLVLAPHNPYQEKERNLKFFSLFVPAGCPLGLLPLLVLIEFISYLAKNVLLGLRLAANNKYFKLSVLVLGSTIITYGLGVPLLNTALLVIFIFILLLVLALIMENPMRLIMENPMAFCNSLE
jgi:F0F1-type ATP synthase membrane subunit a